MKTSVCPFLKDTKQFWTQKAISQTFHTRSFRLIHLSVVRFRLTNNGFLDLLRKGLWPQLFKTPINRYTVGRDSTGKNADWHWSVPHVKSLSPLLTPLCFFAVPNLTEPLRKAATAVLTSSTKIAYKFQTTMSPNSGKELSIYAMHTPIHCI